MLSKGQGRTMGSYFTLLNALAEDGRLDEAEELWTTIFSQNLEGTPRKFFNKVISIYYKRGMHDKMFEVLFFGLTKVYVTFLSYENKRCYWLFNLIGYRHDGLTFE